MWHRSSGIFKYEFGGKAIVLADQGISDFYRSLIPKWIGHQPQLFPAHISVIRKEHPPLMDKWNLHDGEIIDFEYQPIITNDDTYFWLNVRCERLQAIRTELGLNPFPWWPNGYHLTIANRKAWQ